MLGPKSLRVDRTPAPFDTDEWVGWRPCPDRAGQEDMAAGCPFGNSVSKITPLQEGFIMFAARSFPRIITHRLRKSPKETIKILSFQSDFVLSTFWIICALSGQNCKFIIFLLG